MSAADQVDQIIADAHTVATEKAQEASSYADQAQTAALTVTNLSGPLTVTAEPFALPPFSPDVQLAATYKSDFDAEWAGIEDWVRGLMTDYMNTYFPILDPCIQPSEDTWLCSVVNNGYIGIPDAIEQQMWDRARSKDSIEALRMEQEAAEQFSARGFSLPPGVLTNRMQQVQQEAANKSSTIGRDLAIKNIEISIEMVKFAIGEMTKLRIGIAQALADFIKAWLAIPLAAADIAKAKAEMNKYLWDSSADYIRALVAYHSLDLEAQKANQAMQEINTRSFTELVNNNTNARVNAAVSAADAMGRIAQAAMAGQNTLAHIGSVATTSA